MPTFHVPTQLRRYTQGDRVADVPEGTTGEVLAAVIAKWPNLGSALLDGSGKLLPHVVLCVNGDALTRGSAADAQVTTNDEVRVLVAVAGG